MRLHQTPYLDLNIVVDLLASRIAILDPSQKLYHN